jgi:tetratricopeptide (TPR) repeat protein
MAAVVEASGQDGASSLDPELASIARHALAEWAPGADARISSLAPGLSDAALLRTDLSGDASREGGLAGVYVLKVARGDGEPRTDRPGEERARSADAEFAKTHVPQVVRHWSGTTGDGVAGSALLLEIAGGSLRRYTAPARRGSEPLLACIGQLVGGIANAWTDQSNVVTVSPREFLDAALGPEKAEQALTMADEHIGASGVRHTYGHTFVSPSRLSQSPAECRLVRAFQHGDLHTGNVILPVEPQSESEDFWLIDFERCADGFFGLDLAYLELSVICDFFDDLNGASLARCLKHAEFPQLHHPVPDDLQWLAAFMRANREAVAEYGATTAGRADDLEQQMVLARIAEGLRWARRHEGRRTGQLAILYASWYTAQLERITAELADSAAGPTISLEPAEAGGGLTESEQEIWDNLWNQAGHFARRDWTYVLIAERIGDDASLGALGNLPFSAIVDLDPNSDRDGLYSHAGPVLASSRAVHVFSDKLPVSDDRHGTLWLMSAGSRLRREAPIGFRQWFRTRLRQVRGLFEALRRRAGDGQVVVLALLGQHQADDAASSEDRLVRVIEAVDETWEGKATLHVVGETTLRSVVPVANHPIAPRKLVDQLAAMYGAEETTSEYRLPGADGVTVVVPQETLQVLREYFEVLHHRIAAGGAEDEQANDAFWRGGQILWSDLAGELDVARDVGVDLKRAILDSLENHRTQTVVLQHRPGTGGTTAALRAAWDIHHLFPVAVLRSAQTLNGERIGLLADRLHRLFVLTERPVLLVADAGDLSESNRELLYRELAARNARVTLLYVRRSLSPANGGLAVSDPLSREEGNAFLARFRELTDDHARIAELDALGTPNFERYRTPFFYGLITYQRDFTKVAEYVSHHIREVAGRARDVLGHLALVTMYSNSGLQLGLLQRLLRLEPTSGALTIDDMLGPAAALVVLRGGRYRIAHHLLAEELLASLVGIEDWRLHLGDLALDFIEDVAATADTSADPVRLLFQQVFTDRVAGVTEGIEDRGVFAPIVEDLDDSVGHQILQALTEAIPDDPHFWNHLGRHQIYRLQRDLDKAEGYLEQAISLSPEDPLHHHTLGLARRERLNQGLRTSEGKGTEAVMDVIERGFERTVECFERSRQLAPDDIYGYITHVQTILRAARTLRFAARVDTVAELPAVASEWVVEQLTIANGLLDDAAQLYGTLERQDDYLQKCLAEIKNLYGDLDAVVDLWEVDNARGRSTPFSRRALAQAYLVRAKRRWRALSEPELQRIAALAEDNLRRSSAREEDYRLWFEARKLLPDFDVEQALGHLELWSARLPSWRAAYYRYVLHFYLWLFERSEDLRPFESAQEECLKLVPGRVNHSHIWLGKDPGWCPLVADSDLGEWDRHKRFWHDTSLLQRVNGVIDLINGPASGRVVIGDSRARAFFVPAAGGFMAQADENSSVNFFLGFSPAGLRAWGLERGHVEGALTRDGEIVELPELVSRPREVNYEQVQRQRAESLRVERVRELVRSFGEAALARSASVELSWIEERVLATLGVGSADALDEGSLRRMAMAIPNVRIDESGDDGVTVVRRRDGGPAPSKASPDGLEVGFVSHYDKLRGSGVITRDDGTSLRLSASDLDPGSEAEIQRNAVVRFLPSRERRTERALRIEVLPENSSLFEGRVIPVDELVPLVRGEGRRILEEHAKQERSRLTADKLEELLEQAFRGGKPLNRRLGVDGLRLFLREEDWLIVRGRPGAQTVELDPKLLAVNETFGQLHDGPRENGESQETAGEDLREAVRKTVAELRSSRDQVILQALGPALKRRLGKAKYEAFTGSKGLKRALGELGDWSLVSAGPGKVEVRPAEPGNGGSADTESGADPGGANASGTNGSPVDAAKAAVADLRGQHDQVTLQLVGAALRESLGRKAYDEFVGTKRLRRKLEEVGEWRLVEIKPGLVVVDPPPGTAGMPEKPKTAPEANEVRRLVAEFREALIANGKQPTIQSVGSHLRETLGPDAYRALVDEEGLLQTLKRLEAWDQE